jgi:hypothetical protein
VQSQQASVAIGSACVLKRSVSASNDALPSVAALLNCIPQRPSSRRRYACDRAHRKGYGPRRTSGDASAADDHPLFVTVPRRKPFRRNALGRCRIVGPSLRTVNKCA